MKLRYIFMLLAVSLSLLSIAAHRVDARGSASSSDGCLISHFNGTIDGGGTVLAGLSFYEGETIHFTSATSVNFDLVGPFGVHASKSGVKQLSYRLPKSGVYTYSITPVDGVATHLSLACDPTRTSMGCLISNAYMVKVGTTPGLTYSLDYNAGERLSVSSTQPVNVTITGAASASFTGMISVIYIFPVSGSYTVVITAVSAPALVSTACALNPSRSSSAVFADSTGFVLRTIACDTALYGTPAGAPVEGTRVTADQTWYINPVYIKAADDSLWAEIFVGGSQNPYIPARCLK